MKLGVVVVCCCLLAASADSVRDMRQGRDAADDGDFMSWYTPMEPWVNEGSTRSGTGSNEAGKPDKVP